ncbi:MAG TPA: hypothetical protein PLP34_03180 [Chitinophagaceae bacterium]|nr:hypothetical protein [Chitinophagaceae bacterium]
MMKNRFYLLLSGSALSCIITVLIVHKTGLSLGVLILALITLLSYLISVRSVDGKNPHRFVRGVMGATFLKLMLCIAAVAVWLFWQKAHFIKSDLYFLMGVYVLFSVVEAFSLSRLSKKTD